jgi:hypothetical protein
MVDSFRQRNYYSIYIIAYLVGANIFFICAEGPNKKHVEDIPSIFPMLYNTAKGYGLPLNSFTNRKVLPIDIKNPKMMQKMQHINRCSKLIEGQSEQHCSSNSERHNRSNKIQTFIYAVTSVPSYQVFGCRSS